MAGDGGLLEGETTQTVANGGDGTPVTAIPNLGYSFVRWSDDIVDNPRTDINVSGDISVTAIFEPIVYNLIFKDYDDSIIQTTEYEFGVDLSAHENPADPVRTNYTFTGWDIEVPDTMPDEDVIITAEYVPSAYTLTYTTDGNGTIDGEESQTVSPGENGTAVEAIPNTGYYFVRWSDNVEDAIRIDINVMANLSVNAIFAPNQYTLTYLAGENGSIESNSIQTVSHGSSGVAVNAIADQDYGFVRWSDDRTDNPRTDRNVSGDITVTAIFDLAGPIISDLNSDPTDDSVTISWETDESANTVLRYGVSLSYGVSVNDANLTTEHNVSIGNLTPCATYYYEAKSQDIDLDSTTATGSFTTLGCAGSASILANNEVPVVTSTSNTASLSISDVLVLRLNIPANYANKNAVFQLKKIDDNEALLETGSPENKEKAGDHFYSLTAISDDEDLELIDSFSEPITITIYYTDSDVVGLDEDTLQIHRWDGSIWHVLSDCLVNKNNQSITCSTERFSSFAIFGDEIEEEEDAPLERRRSSGSSAISRYQNLLAMNKKEDANELAKQFPDQMPLNLNNNDNDDNNNLNQNKFIFTKNLKLNMIDNEVKELQRFLNDKGYELVKNGPGSKVNETNKFGSLTKKAVIKFQKANGLTQDGIVGPKTREKLNL